MFIYMYSYGDELKAKTYCGAPPHYTRVGMVLICMSCQVTLYKLNLKNLQNLRHWAILQAISALKMISFSYPAVKGNVDEQQMHKHNFHFLCVHLIT